MSAKRMLVAEQWDQFARAAMPKDCPVFQRQEMRRAFYAGARGIFHGIVGTMSAGGEVEESDIQALAGVEKKLSDFADAVKAGRA